MSKVTKKNKINQQTLISKVKVLEIKFTKLNDELKQKNKKISDLEN